VMAAYGAQLEQGKSEDEAVAYLEALFRRISVQDKSARESLQTFAGGKGDVLLAYENEAITAKQKGEELDYVIPDETILIENPIAVTKDAPEQARAFVAFLRTPESQRVFAGKGYRSILDGEIDEKTYPTPETLFTIADLGGWAEVQERYFDREEGIVAGIQRDVGAPLE
jgi:sulfate/thiosulfate transport system substrate-binding protein